MTLLELRLRANPAFELVLADRLSAAEQRLLAGLGSDPDHYGVLRPGRGSGLGWKAVDRETALLFLTLDRPGPLPGYVRHRLGEAAAMRALQRLVADGVLEVELQEGQFVSGAAAMALCAGGAGEAGGRLAQLSRAALRYGEELARTLPEVEAMRLSLRLYGYHRLPLTPRWQRALPGPEAVHGYLGIAVGGRWRPLLERHWRELAMDGGDPWLRWRPRAAASRAGGAGPAGASGAAGVAGAAAGGVTYKLYVSAMAEALPEAFGAILDGLAAMGAPGFKVGATAGGLLRPDKIVAYFAGFEQLAAAAGMLAERLAGVAAHGVPFTSEIAGLGLLSWGVDPPAAAGPGPPGGAGGTSWRLWLTHRLARALLAAVASDAGRVGKVGIAGGHRDSGDGGDADRAGSAKAAGEQVEPWRFAVERLRLEGVDTDSWTPGGGVFREQGAGAWR